MVDQPSALCGALYARTLFVDESSRTMVLDPPTETLENRRFCIQRPPTGEAQAVHPRMEPTCASVQLVHEVRGQGNGRSACPGGVII